MGGVHYYSHRDSGLELYRIIVMLLIIAHHYVVNSGLTDILCENPDTNKTTFLWLFGAFGKTGINCFVLITGYFMCTRDITSRKFFKLLFEIYFYRIAIYVIFCITGYETVSWINIIKQIVPIWSINDGFIECFLVFYLTIPFLSILIHQIDKKMHLRLILLIFTLFVCFDSLPWFNVSFSYVSWFMALFLVASYIRLYPNEIFDQTRLWCWMSLVLLLFDCLSVVIFMENEFWQYFWLADSNKILAFLTSIAWFLLFKNIRIKQSGIINLFGGATFGVLCIHANSDAMIIWLWKDLLHNADVYSNGNMIYWHSILSVLGIFLVCTVIDIIRQNTIEIPFLDWFDIVWGKIVVRLLDLENRILQRL